MHIDFETLQILGAGDKPSWLSKSEARSSRGICFWKKIYRGGGHVPPKDSHDVIVHSSLLAVPEHGYGMPVISGHDAHSGFKPNAASPEDVAFGNLVSRHVRRGSRIGG